MKAKNDEKKRTMGVHDERKRPSGVHATKMGPDDFQLHVHSNHGTGGHWCAKIFFFSLFIILLGLICLIIMENRGLEDLDRPLSESRYAEMLEGWVDDDDDAHDNHNGKKQMHDKKSVYHDQHDDKEHHSEEENSLENELDDKIDENEIEDVAEDENEIEDENEDENEDEMEDETEDENVDETEDQTEAETEDKTEDETEDQTKQEQEENSIENEMNNKNDDHPVSSEIEDDDEGFSEEIHSPQDIIEPKTLNLNEIEIADPLEDEMVEESEVDHFDKHETEDESTSDDSIDDPTETSPLAVRIIVGLALVIVAHQVLLKRPRTTNENVVQYQDPETIEENPEIIEMKRRLTLVTAEEPIPLNEEDMKEHPPIIEDIPANEKEEFLLTSNSPTDETIKDITPEESQFEDDPISDEIAINEEMDFDSEEEILSSEDIYSDEEINDYESSETSDIDDSDLLKRLDEKYGKLPQHSGTDDIDNDPTWTKIDHSGSPAIERYVESDLTRDQHSQESNDQ